MTWKSFARGTVVFVLSNALTLSHNAWAQRTSRPVAPTTDSTVSSTIVDEQPQQVTTQQEAPAPRVQRPAPRYRDENGKSGKRPNLSNIVLGFDKGISLEMKIAFMKKYPGISVQDNCDARPVACFFTDRIALREVLSGNGYGSVWASGARSDARTNSYRSGSFGESDWAAFSGEKFKLDMGIVLLTDNYYPQLIAGVTNLAFPGTSGSSGWFSGSQFGASGNANGFRSGGASWSGGGSATSTVYRDAAIEGSFDNAVKRLCAVSTSWGDWSVKIDNRIHATWLPGAAPALRDAFNL